MHFSITTYRIAILIGCLMLAGGSLLTVEHLQAGKAEVRELDACELYIQNYSQAAIHQQRKHRIPASITLAQGILESSAGKSYLAIEGKNHFGIKCGNWTGEFVYKQDDGRLERFRKYATVEQSFEDHSRFIAERSPYKSLFDLKPTDYVGWAHGLKRCGYATDPKYAHKLIELIERYGLHNYDLAQGTDEPPAVQRRSRTRTAPPEAPKRRIAEPKPARKETLTPPSREVAAVQREPGRKPTAHGVKVPKKAKPEQAPPKTEPAPKPAPAPAQKPAPAPKPAPTPAPQKEAAPAAKPAPAKQPAAQKQVAAAKPAPAAKKQASWEAKKPAPQKAAPAAKPAPAKQPAAQKQVAAAKPAPSAKKQAWAAKKPAPQKAAPAAKPVPAKQPAAQKQVAAKQPAPAAKKQAWAAKKPAPPKAAPAAKPVPAKQPAAQKQVAAKKPAPAAKKQAWAAKKPAPTAAPKKQDKKLLASTKKSGTAVAPKAAPNATRPAAANPAVKKNAWKKPVTPKKSAVAPQKTVATAKKPATTPKKPAAVAKKPATAPKKPAAAAKKPAAAPKKSAWVAKKPAPTPKATAPKRAPRPAQRSALSRKQNNNERPTVHTARRQRLERRRS